MCQLGDGVDANDVPFRNSFPYLAVAHDGTSSVPHGVEAAAVGSTQPPAGVQAPGMPITGSPIYDLGDIYPVVLGGITALGGILLLTGYAIRRRNSVKVNNKK